MVEFKEFPKMARLSREVIITEKIDGTNASIFIQNAKLETNLNDENIISINSPYENVSYTIRAGSKNKWITPNNDNFGFANWCLNNASELVKLGEGHHFGEWWGSGIQRGYDLPKGEKRFSLFNVQRWKWWSDTDVDNNKERLPPLIGLVPVLYRGSFDYVNEQVEYCLNLLKTEGSRAKSGFMKPEGIVVYHIAGNVGFKKTIENDEIPKSLIK